MVPRTSSTTSCRRAPTSGLAKQPQQRFDDARALATAIDQALAGALDPRTAHRGRVLASACKWLADVDDATVELPAS